MTELMLEKTVAFEDELEAKLPVDESFSEEYIGLLNHRKELKMIENILWHHFIQSENKPQVEKEVSKMIQECQDTIAEIDYILTLIELNGCD